VARARGRAMVADTLSGRNRDGRRSARGGGDVTEHVGFAAAHSARDREHGEPVPRAQPANDFSRLLETDADRERETRGAQPTVVAREDTPKAIGQRVRTIGRTQARGAETVQAALVQSLIRETPGDRFAGSQLFATYCTRLSTNARLNIGERRRSAARRPHVRMTSNDGAIEGERPLSQEGCQAPPLQFWEATW